MATSAVDHKGLMVVCVVLVIQRNRAQPSCRGGTYYSVDGTCVPCSKPPERKQTKNSLYSMYCEGVCGKGKRGLYCDQDCSDGCNNAFCNRWTAECIYGCRPNRYGTRCDIPCAHCSSCVDVEGKDCVCNDGYYGWQCKQNCPVNCKNNKCNSDGTCHLGCADGWVGDTCDQQCLNCVNDSHSKCLIGWYGQTCRQSCQHRCSKGLCRVSGSCIAGCLEGLFGDTCEETCPATCEFPSCKTDGTCNSCRDGYRGSRCDETCDLKCRACHQIRNMCKSCTSGRFGNSCQFHCNNCRNGLCYKTNGRCSRGCKNGMYGPYCGKRCNRNCRWHSADTCLMDSGWCNHGCRRGWFGIQCDRTCASGCRYPCDRETGECSAGCKPSFYGTFCNSSCSDHCLNSNCILTIDGFTAVCANGCTDGWSGPYCTRANTSPWIVIAITVVPVGIACCLAGVVCRKQVLRWTRRRQQRRQYLTAVGGIVYTASTDTTGNADGRQDADTNSYEDMAEVGAVNDLQDRGYREFRANDQHDYHAPYEAIYEQVQ